MKLVVADKSPCNSIYIKTNIYIYIYIERERERERERKIDKKIIQVGEIYWETKLTL